VKQLLEWLSPFNLRLTIIAGPWLIAAIYLSVFAADRYASESVIAVRQEGTGMVIPSGVEALSAMFGTSAGSREDQFMLQAHILSNDILRQVDEKLNLRQAYSSPKFDFIFRMARDAPQEDFVDYFRSRIEVLVDDASGLLTIRTQGFTPDIAQAVNLEVVAISERFINESSHRLARDQMAFAQRELESARARLDDARGRLLEFQEQHSMLDPAAQAVASTGLTAELQAILARYEAELKGMLAYLTDDAPQIQAMQAQVAGLREQLKTEGMRGVTNEEGISLNVLAGRYLELAAELEFMSDAYRGALIALETARIESTRKLKSLVLVESPALPEAAEYPRRVYTLVALLMALLLLYGIGRLIVATIEDHRE
jgi:capsular polysaccharide transport system permease protein